jgi:HSP20 family protein
MSILTRKQQLDQAVWPTVGRLFGLPSELEDLFENPLSQLTHATGLLRVWNPAVDVHEDKDNVFVRAELPGLKKENIDVSLHEGVLSISGERKDEAKYEDAQIHRSERFTGQFHRSITLPTLVKADAVTAHYQDGVLAITLPKAEEAKTKRIEVKID